MDAISKLGADDKKVMDAAGKAIMIKNPDFKDWDALGKVTDQHVLSYLLGSLSKDILVQVSSCNTAAEAWTMIQGMYADSITICEHSYCLSHDPQRHFDRYRVLRQDESTRR
jgi:hypothetical protein